ncbi:MAG: hypothetical protein KGL39_05235 [Patescibacteria group bacterium]|nr:hypothetical protein [Patescibacteria group bacterium]
MATGDFDPRILGMIWTDAHGWVHPNTLPPLGGQLISIIDLSAQITAALARIKELEDGLRPFADAASTYDPDEGDGSNVAWMHDFTIASLRRARDLLAKKGEE